MCPSLVHSKDKNSRLQWRWRVPSYQKKKKKIILFLLLMFSDSLHFSKPRK